MRWLRSLFGGGKAAKKASPTAPADIFVGLRSQILKLSKTSDASAQNGNAPLAILMETAYPEAVATLVAVHDGTATLYFSNGGGIIGSGQHPPVAAAAKVWLTQAGAEFASAMTEAVEFPLPAPGQVRFYLIFPGRILTAEAAENDLGYGRHSFSPLFHAGQEVITQIRLHAPK